RPGTASPVAFFHAGAKLRPLAPGLVNPAGSTPGLSHLMKWFGGISQHRDLPAFAQQTFTDWFRARPPRNQDRPPVLLWPDTFSNHFHPAIAKAAVDVLEHAGYQVTIPGQSLCCGRPLYDFCMLAPARSLLQQLLRALQPQIAAGTPIIGLEPSCVSVFRDEMTNLLGDNQAAQQLKAHTFLLSEFLICQANYQPPQLRRKALV